MLTPIERQSALWLKIEAHLKERLSVLRVRNDTNLDERRTERLRGRIAEVKSLLAFDGSDDE